LQNGKRKNENAQVNSTSRDDDKWSKQTTSEKVAAR